MPPPREKRESKMGSGPCLVDALRQKNCRGEGGRQTHGCGPDERGKWSPLMKDCKGGFEQATRALALKKKKKLFLE